MIFYIIFKETDFEIQTHESRTNSQPKEGIELPAPY